MKELEPRYIARKRRHRRIRKKIFGTPERPRLCVFISNRYVYAQIIDDENQRTLVSASSCIFKSPDNNRKSLKNIAIAAKVGELISQRAKEKNITKVVFDRAGYKYHGRVKALAEAARAGGLEF